jgi:hypothetical protein
MAAELTRILARRALHPFQVLKAVGALPDATKARDSKALRAGKGKMRNRWGSCCSTAVRPELLVPVRSAITPPCPGAVLL